MTKKNKFATFVAKTIPTVSNDMAKWYHESLVFESNVVAEGRVKRKTVEVSLKEGNTLPVDNINPVMSTANSGDTNPGIVAIDRRDGGKFVTTESSSIICNNTPVKETFDEKAAEGTLIPNKTKSSISITPRDHTPAEETFIDKAAGGTLILNKTKSSLTMCEGTPAEETFDEKAAERSFIRKKTSSNISGEQQGVEKKVLYLLLLKVLLILPTLKMEICQETTIRKIQFTKIRISSW